MVTLAGNWAQDAGARYGSGPVLPSSGSGYGFEGVDLGNSGSGTLGLKVVLYSASGTALLTAPVALADNLANPTTIQVGADNLVYDAVNAVWLRALAAKINGGSFDAATLKPPVGVIMAWDGTSGVYKPLQAARGIGDTNNGDTSLTVANMLFDGANWNKQRANIEGTALASGSRSGTTSSADLVNYNSRGLWAFLNVTVNPGGAQTLTLSVDGKDPVASGYQAVTAFTAVLAGGGTGLFAFQVYPGAALTTAVSSDQSQGVVLPRTFRITVTHSGAGAWTYSVGYAMIN